MPLFERWRQDQSAHRQIASYIDHIMTDPASEDVVWLAGAATGGDEDHARWELRYARRALGLLAAQRDALDDRTPSMIARALTAAFATDPAIDARMLGVVERQFNARLSAYRDALGAKGDIPTDARLGQILLAFSGGALRSVEPEVRRGGAVLAAYLDAAGEALREAFGAPALPEDLPPSESLR